MTKEEQDQLNAQAEAEAAAAVSGQPIQEFAPAPNPDLSLLEARLEALQSKIREQEMRNEDLRFQLDVLQDPMGYAQGGWSGPSGAPPLPQFPDPDQPVSVRDLAAVTQNLLLASQVAAMRAAWDVTPAEEQQALQSFPRLAQVPEPKRTEAIREVVKKARARAVELNPATPAPKPQQQQRRPPPQVESQLYRQAPSTTPAPEAGQGGGGHGEPDSTMTGALMDAYKEYEVAKKIRNPREKRTAMREAADKIARLQGKRTYGDIIGAGSFSQKRTPPLI